jgi:hypothetical protein
MPKRSNDFQKLIHFIERQVAPLGASVDESVELIDKVTGKPVEVDILVTIPTAVREIRTAIECRGRGRPETVEWIRELRGKFEHLDVDRVVAVARQGFTAEATAKARIWRIDTLTLAEAGSQDWSATIRTIASVEIFETRFELRRVGFEIGGGTEPLPGPDAFPSSADEMRLVVAQKGGASALGAGSRLTLSDLIRGLVAIPGFDERIAKQCATNQSGVAEVGINVESGSGIFTATGLLYELSALKLFFGQAVETHVVPITHSMYGTVAVAVGNARYQDGGTIRIGYVQVSGSTPHGIAEITVDGRSWTAPLPNPVFPDKPSHSEPR